MPLAAAGSLRDLEAQVKTCQLCRLAKTRTRAVPGDGNFRAEDTLLMTSDHGNVESIAAPTHTRNPVPLLAVGPAAWAFAGVASIADIADVIDSVTSDE